MTKTEIVDAAKKRLAELDAERADLVRMIGAATGENAAVSKPAAPAEPYTYPWMVPSILPARLEPATPWIGQGHGTHCACQQCCPPFWCGDRVPSTQLLPLIDAMTIGSTLRISGDPITSGWTLDVH